jgi:hypothetical protein
MLLAYACTILYVFFWLLGFEFRPLCLLGRHSTALPRLLTLILYFLLLSQRTLSTYKKS